MDKLEFTRRVLEAEDTMYRVARSIAVNEKDCEDAVQEAILTAYVKLGTLREERYFKTWLIRILINECRRTVRRRGAPVLTDGDWAFTAPEDGADMELREALLSLPVKIRQAVVLHYIEGYGVEETAYMMSIPAGTVKSRLHKGRELLRQALEDKE